MEPPLKTAELRLMLTTQSERAPSGGFPTEGLEEGLTTLSSNQKCRIQSPAQGAFTKVPTETQKAEARPCPFVYIIPKPEQMDSERGFFFFFFKLLADLSGFVREDSECHRRALFCGHKRGLS